MSDAQGANAPSPVPYYPTPEDFEANRNKFTDGELGALIKLYYDTRKRLNDAGIYV